jgi:thiopeptide-type bacteriocin biosynthesis protein
MTGSPWRQITIEFPDWDQAEHTAIVHVLPILAGAETEQVITRWFFIRKKPGWRLRYQPTSNADAASAYLHQRLHRLQQQGCITRAIGIVYEPETHAFGGPEAMTAAHQLWQADSKHLLTYLAATIDNPAVRRTRELAILLCATMTRAARLDWYEQGDVWARVAAHRPHPDRLDTHALRTLQAAVRQLMTADTSRLALPGATPPDPVTWVSAFTTAGHQLGALNTNGLLRRGLRDILAHQVIFAWNRLGLPATTQAALATTAATATFGVPPALERCDTCPADQLSLSAVSSAGGRR